MSLEEALWHKVKSLEAAKASGGMGYTETQTVEVLPETTIECAYMEDVGMILGFSAPFELNEGDPYTVVWDGVRYSGVYSITRDENGEEVASAFGNLSLLGMGDDTGEPFLCMADTNGAEGEFVSAFFVAEEGTHTVSVSIFKQSIRTIDEKYIPPLSGVLPVVDIGDLRDVATTSVSRALFEAATKKTPIIARFTSADGGYKYYVLMSFFTNEDGTIMGFAGAYDRCDDQVCDHIMFRKEPIEDLWSLGIN